MTLDSHQRPGQRALPDVFRHASAVARSRRLGEGMTVWLTGLSGAGKSSVGVEIERRLVATGRPAYLLDGDNLRCGLNAGLGYSACDRKENVRRAGEVAKLFADAGVVAVVSLISPFRSDREQVRRRHEADGLPFVEVFVDTPLDVCAQRDPKGLYARALAGEVDDFTGISSPYEAPSSPDVVLRPSDGSAAEQADLVLARLSR